MSARAYPSPLWATFLMAVVAACQRAPAPAASASAQEVPRLSVSLRKVERRPMPASLPLAGFLVADRQADIAANASGRVDRTHVERGDAVAEGAVLVDLDARQVAFGAHEARANVEVAAARDSLARAQCQRNRDLFARGAISKDEWDRIDSACRTSSADAAAATARAKKSAATLADATVRAPFAGRVQDRYVSVGEYVQPATRVVTLVGVSPLRLQLTVAEADLGRVHVGQVVHFEVEAYPKEVFSGPLKYIDPAVRLDSRDLRVEALVDNQAGRLRAGMSAAARLELGDAPSLAVPTSAVTGEGRAARAFVVAEGRLIERLLQLGARRDDWVVVLDGLAEGESVVAPITPDVRDGARVR